MRKTVPNATFAHTPKTEHLVDRLRQHARNPTIEPVAFDKLIAYQQKLRSDVDQVFVSGSLEQIKVVGLFQSIVEWRAT